MKKFPLCGDNILNKKSKFKKCKIFFNINKTKKSEGVDGWLIIVLIGLFYSAISILLFIKDYLIGQINEGTFGLLTNPYSYFYKPGYKSIFLFETIGNLLIIFFIFLLIYILFCKHRIFPKLFKIILVLYFLFILINNILYLTFFDYEISYIKLGESFIFMIVGLLYIYKSIRVKNTFVEKSYKNNNILSLILLFTLLLLTLNIILSIDINKLNYNDFQHGNDLCIKNFGYYSKYSGKIENGEFVCECHEGYEFGGINGGDCVKKIIYGK